MGLGSEDSPGPGGLGRSQPASSTRFSTRSAVRVIRWLEPAHNPSLSLNVTALPGLWNATTCVKMPKPLSGLELAFGIPQNEIVVASLGVAFVHTSVLSCGVTIATSVSQSVKSSVAGVGTTATYNSSAVWPAAPVPDGESTVSTPYPTTGILDETTSQWTRPNHREIVLEVRHHGLRRCNIREIMGLQHAGEVGQHGPKSLVDRREQLLGRRHELWSPREGEAVNRVTISALVGPGFQAKE